MQRFRIFSGISPTGELDDTFDIPSDFVPLVTEEWINRSKGPILEIVLEDRSDAEWRRTGEELVELLTREAIDIGLCITGNFRAALVLKWTREITEIDGPGTIGFQWTQSVQPSRMLSREVQYVENGTWCTIQEKQAATWVGGVWGETGSDLFIGADLILAAYSDDVASKADPLSALTLACFEKTIRDSIGWIIPVEGNGGFVVGMSAETEMYRFMEAMQRG